MRRLCRTFVSTALAAVVLAAAACSSTDTPNDTGQAGDAPTKITYLTSFAQFGRDAYVHVAKEKGFFAEVGLDVTIQPGTGTDNAKQLAGGQAQFAAVDFTGALLQITGESKVDIVAIAAIHQRSLAAVMALEGSGITAPKDLEGKTIADSPSSVVRLLFPTYARLANVDRSKVKWVDSAPDQLFVALGTGKANAIGQFVVGKPSAEFATKKPTILLPYSDYMSDLYGVGIFAARSYAKENAEAVKKFRAAIVKGLTYAIANPDEAAEILKKTVPTTNVASAAAELKLMAPFVGSTPGSFDKAKVARSIALLQGTGAIPAGLQPEQVLAEGATG